MNRIILLLAGLVIVAMSCGEKKDAPLPVIGNRVELNGDTLHHRIRPFTFVNQLGDSMTNADFEGKIYVADMFFTSCPTICPKVKQQMLRIYDKVKGDPDFKLASHTIDPVRDKVDVLKAYADNMGVDHNQWYFLTGDKELTYEVADDYFIAAYEDEEAPGGFDHSGKIIMLDKQGRIRSFCDGTDPESVTKMLGHIDILKKEYE